MQSDDGAEPAQWDVDELKRSIDEWEAIATHILKLLQESAEDTGGQNWQPHRAQIIAVVNRFRQLCRRESQQLGSWREDGLAPDDAYERVWNEGDQLVQWLQRMMRP
jgi:hypothetical protein